MQAFRGFVTNLGRWSVPSLAEGVAKTFVLLSLAQIVTAEQYGLFTILLLIFSYHSLAQLGVADFLAIILPVYFRENKLSQFRREIGVSLFYTTLTLLAIGLVAVPVLTIADVFVSFLLLLSTLTYQYFIHNVLSSRYSYELSLIAKARYIIIASRLFIQLPSIWIFGIKGYFFIECLHYFAAGLCINRFSNYKIIINADRIAFKGLIRRSYYYFLMMVSALIIAGYDRFMTVCCLT